MKIRFTGNDTMEIFDHDIVINDKNNIEFSDLFFQNVFNSIGGSDRSFTIGDIHIFCKNATVVINNFTLGDTIYLYSFSDVNSSIAILKCNNSNLHIVDIDVKHMEIEKGNLLLANSKTGEIYIDASSFMNPNLENSIVDNYKNIIDIRSSDVDKLMYHQSATAIVINESNIREITAYVRGNKKIHVDLFSLYKSNIELLQIGVECDKLQFTESFIRRLFFQSSTKITEFELINSDIQFVNECKLEYFALHNLSVWKIIKQGNYKKNVELHCQAGYKVAKIENDLCISQEENKIKKCILIITNSFLKSCNGYGYKPQNAVKFTAGTILIFGILFYLIDYIGLLLSGNMIFGAKYLVQNLKDLFEYIYLSGITFTTIGFTELGNLSWLSRFLILIEGCLGVATLSLFVTALVKKYSD